MCPGMDKAAQSLIGVSGIHQQHMRTLLVILAYHVVGEKRFPAARRSEDEFVPVGDCAVLHRQVGNIQMDGFSGQAVHHADAKRRERVLVGGFPDEQAQGLLDKGVETLLGREISGIAGYCRPEEGRYIHRVVARFGFHQRQLAAHIVLDALQLFPVIAPCHDIAVRTDGNQPFAVCLVQVLLNPFAVDLVGTAVTGKRVHVPCGLLEFPENFSRIINEEILVHHMVAGKQDAYRCGKGQPAVAPVCREPFIPAIG